MNGVEAFEYALGHIDRGPDGSVDERVLVELVASSIDFDEDKARLGLAQRIVARRKRPGQTKPDGQLIIPGLEPFAYEPQRLITDDKGRLVENARARPSFKAAAARHAQKAAADAQETARREQEQYALYAEWAMAELAKGRSGDEITWDTCVRELHLWKDEDPPAGHDTAEREEG